MTESKETNVNKLHGELVTHAHLFRKSAREIVYQLLIATEQKRAVAEEQLDARQQEVAAKDKALAAKQAELEKVQAELAAQTAAAGSENKADEEVIKETQERKSLAAKVNQQQVILKNHKSELAHQTSKVKTDLREAKKEGTDNSTVVDPPTAPAALCVKALRSSPNWPVMSGTVG